MVAETKTGMAYLTLFLSSLLFIGASAANENYRENSSIEINNYHLPDHIKPVYYNVKLILDNARVFGYVGKLNVRIKIFSPTQRISLHAYSYIIIRESTLINEVNNITVRPTIFEFNDKTDIVTFYFKHTLSRGNYHFIINFDSIANNNTKVLYQTTYLNEKGDIEWLIVSHFKAIGARRIFPCWDEPKFRAKFHISILHDRNYTIESNTPLKMLHQHKNNMMSIFRTTPPIPPYLVAIMISNYDGNLNATRSNIWCRQFSAPHIKFARNVARNVKQYFHSAPEFKNLRKDRRVKHVVIPGFQDDGMENWRLIFYRETDIIYHEEIDSVARKTEIACRIARKMAHQWFGNLVSPSKWSYLWMNDGIATLLGMNAIDKIFPDSQMLNLFVVQVQHESFHLDNNTSIVKPLISEINNPSEIDSMSFSRYVKAPAILRMLQHLLTINVYREGLDIYLRNHMFKSATPQNLWTAMQLALNKAPLRKFNVSRVMNTWIKEPCYPEILVIQYSPTHVIVELLRDYNKNEIRWIPVTITTENESNFNKSFLTDGCWIRSWNISYCEFFLPYEENGWIIANLQQAGYYRVNYDTEMWERIAYYLDSPKYLNIHVLNRAQIIDDAFHFMTTKKLYPSIFWEIASSLWKEKEYIVWYPMIKAFERMSSVLSLPEEKTKRIRTKISHILDDVLGEIEYESDPDDSDQMQCLRDELIKWACVLELPECLHMAHSTLIDFLRSSQRYKVIPSWMELIYCNGMKRANQAWTDMLHLWQETRNDIMLRSLTCSKNFHIIQVFFMMIGQKDSALNLSLKDHINTYFLIVAKHARNTYPDIIEKGIVYRKILDIILNKFEVKPREISTIAALTYVINHVNSKQHLDKISAFVNNNKKQLISIVQSKIEIRQFQIKQQKNYLRNIIPDKPGKKSPLLEE